MAWDEALLEWVTRLGRPILRVYGWRGNAATFGYFQRWADVQGWTSLRPLIRRPTGGGLVPHDADWTYSVVVPPGHPRYSLRAEDSYRQLHEWLRDAFRGCGIATELAPCCDPTGPGRCFVGAERQDLILAGQKIAGAAQRRNRLGLLIQGSVQPVPSGLSRPDWHGALKAALPEVHWTPCDALTEVQELAERLAREKYGTTTYNERR